MKSTRKMNKALLCAVVIPLFTWGPVSYATAQSGCAPPPAGLVSWWDADSLSGATALDIQDGNDGTMSGGADVAAGKVGNAFSFDGVDDFVDVPDAPNLDITGAITIAAWINPTAFPIGFGGIVTKFGSNTGYGMFFTNLGGVDGFTGHGFGFSWVQGTSGSVPLAEFSHVAMTHDGSTLTIYVNGAADNSVGAGLIRTSGAPLFIGARDSLGALAQPFAGLIDEVEVYDRALSGSEILAIFNAGSGGTCKPGAPASDPPVAGDPPGSHATVHHFECYKVKTAKGEPKFEPVPVEMSNPFGEGTHDTTVKKPKTVCVAVDKDGKEITHDDSYVTCYAIKKQKKHKGEWKFERLDVMVDNEFNGVDEPQVLTVKKPKLYCVPSTIEVE